LDWITCIVIAQSTGTEATKCKIVESFIDVSYQALEDAARRRGQEMRPSEEDVRCVEEERIQVLNNMEELEQKIKELDNQMDESAQEVKRRVMGD